MKRSTMEESFYVPQKRKLSNFSPEQPHWFQIQHFSLKVFIIDIVVFVFVIVVLVVDIVAFVN